MKKTTFNTGIIFISISLVAGVANAACPDDMPLKLLKDCIVVEGSESTSIIDEGNATFPDEDYYNLPLYREWLAARKVKNSVNIGSENEEE
ncbi:MAG: hypothetical protein KZQ83_14175 [gamma proteobacterium symbiont of Taylorina sp.]|nr:hypothetical protein [gamma proteobacterium symbiont of Taylorina sp.]